MSKFEQIVKKVDLPFSIFSKLFILIICNSIFAGIILIVLRISVEEGDRFIFSLLAGILLFIEMLWYFFYKIKPSIDIEKVSKDLTKIKRIKKFNLYFSSIEKILTTVIIVNGFILLTDADVSNIINFIDSEDYLLIIITIIASISYLSLVAINIFFEYVIQEVEFFVENNTTDYLVEKRIVKARKYRNRKR